MTTEESRQVTLERLDGMVVDYLARSANCAQTSFVVLQETFDLPDGPMLKALTPFPGVALRGETCGVVIGCMMAIGLVFGRERLDDWTGYRSCLRPARKFTFIFEDKLGSTNCGDILETKFGRHYNLADPSDSMKWMAAGALDKCGQVVLTGVRIAAEIIQAGTK
jgi:C_GCAxxG_C_C family probable redox protein